MSKLFEKEINILRMISQSQKPACFIHPNTTAMENWSCVEEICQRLNVPIKFNTHIPIGQAVFLDEAIRMRDRFEPDLRTGEPNIQDYFDARIKSLHPW